GQRVTLTARACSVVARSLSHATPQWPGSRALRPDLAVSLSAPIRGVGCDLVRRPPSHRNDCCRSIRRRGALEGADTGLSGPSGPEPRRALAPSLFRSWGDGPHRRQSFSGWVPRAEPSREEIPA